MIPNDYFSILLYYYLVDNNRNWRDPKEPDPGPGGETKPKWQHSNSVPHEHHHHHHSNLPEWCNDDEDAIPGSFDASGQFRSFKVSFIFYAISSLDDCLRD